MWLPDEIKKCVAFICVKDNQENIVPAATGFFVTVPSEKKPGVFYGYFVTAKHNIAYIGDRKFWFRVNDKNGKLVNLEPGGKVEWVSHPDHEKTPADLVVMPFPSHDFDILAIPSSMFLTSEEIKSGEIGVGNEVFITGLFRYLSGTEKNIPIVRMGNIAMIPSEKVYSKEFAGEMDAYLIEARSIGGISGSPVFFCRPQQSDKGFSPGIKIYLGGLVHGHWDTLEKNIDMFLPTEDAAESKGVNMGIAIVTPSVKIMEILNSEPLQKLREKYDAV